MFLLWYDVGISSIKAALMDAKAQIDAGDIEAIGKAFSGLKKIKTIEPDRAAESQYKQAYQTWLGALQHLNNV